MARRAQVWLLKGNDGFLHLAYNGRGGAEAVRPRLDYDDRIVGATRITAHDGFCEMGVEEAIGFKAPRGRGPWKVNLKIEVVKARPAARRTRKRPKARAKSVKGGRKRASRPAARPRRRART